MKDQVMRIARHIASRRNARRDARILSSLSPHTLRDIGLDPDVYHNDYRLR